MNVRGLLAPFTPLFLSTLAGCAGQAIVGQSNPADAADDSLIDATMPPPAEGGSDDAGDGTARDDLPDLVSDGSTSTAEPGCPTTPYSNDPCASDGATCIGGCTGCECGQTCQCVAGRWQCALNSCVGG
jgi:hypothetical protein